MAITNTANYNKTKAMEVMTKDQPLEHVENVKKWSTNEVLSWLLRIGLEDLQSKFTIH